MICCWPTFLGKMQFDQNQLQLTFLRVKSQTCPLCIFSSNISPILFFRTHSWGSMLGVSKRKLNWIQKLKLDQIIKIENFPSGGVLGFWGGVGSMGALFLLALGSQRYQSSHLVSCSKGPKKTERVFSTFSTFQMKNTFENLWKVSTCCLFSHLHNIINDYSKYLCYN